MTKRRPPIPDPDTGPPDRLSLKRHQTGKNNERNGIYNPADGYINNDQETETMNKNLTTIQNAEYLQLTNQIS